MKYEVYTMDESAHTLSSEWYDEYIDAFNRFAAIVNTMKYGVNDQVDYVAMYSVTAWGSETKCHVVSSMDLK